MSGNMGKAKNARKRFAVPNFIWLTFVDSLRILILVPKPGVKEMICGIGNLPRLSAAFPYFAFVLAPPGLNNAVSPPKR